MLHARRSDVHPLVLETLRELMEEGKDHLSWIAETLEQYQAAGIADTKSLLHRYREIDKAIYGQVVRFETRLCHFLGPGRGVADS